MDITSLIEKPWERIDWSDEQQMGIFRDWALYYNQRLLPKNADYYYTKALELSPDDIQLLQFRSKCRRDLAEIETAIVDSYVASKINPQSQPIALEVCDALYEMNRFEDNFRKLHDNTMKFTGQKVKDFYNRIDAVGENFKDILGDSLGPFILKNAHVFPTVLKELYLKTHKDMRPLWKILKEQGKCDVESVIEKEEELLSPREIARRERAFNVFNQIYFNRNWSDVLFLKAMRTNQNLLPPKSRVNTPLLRNIVTTNYGILRKFLKMLQSRSPLYNEHFLKCPNKLLCHQFKESLLFRIEHQTRRNMNSILNGIRVMRAAGDMQKLSKFVEDAMGNYVVLKTHRVMPWKFEFVNEVYNTLGLAYTDCFLTSPLAKNPNCPGKLFKENTGKDINKSRSLKFVFGDKASSQANDSSDPATKRYRAFIARLDSRMHFSKYDIERSYLYHEIGRTHLANAHFEECCSVARCGTDVALRCNSYIWAFLCTMLIVKAHSMLHKLERCKEALLKAYTFAELLKSHELCAYINENIVENDLRLHRKKKTQMSEMKGKRSIQSVTTSRDSEGKSE